MRAFLAACAALLFLSAAQADSFQAVPQGAFTAYTPSLGCATGTLTTASATGGYQVTGKRVDWVVTVNVTTNGTCASTLIVGLPPGFTSSSSRIYTAFGRENGKGYIGLQGYIPAGNTVVLVTIAGTNAFPSQDGAQILMSGFYEAQ